MSQIDRRELHTLVDHIPESDMPAARKVLRALADPVELAILAAPLDDEPETEEERAIAAQTGVKRFAQNGQEIWPQMNTDEHRFKKDLRKT